MSEAGGLEDAVLARLRGTLNLTTLKLKVGQIVPAADFDWAEKEGNLEDKMVVVAGPWLREGTITMMAGHAIEDGNWTVAVLCFASTGQAGGLARKRAATLADAAKVALYGWEPVWAEQPDPFPLELEAHCEFLPQFATGTRVCYASRFRVGFTQQSA